MTLFELFYEFVLIGLFSIGGGLATLPFVNNLADKYSWFTHAQLADMIAMSESTPGSIALSLAAYAGYYASGIAGSLVATFSLILPSLIIVIIVSKFLSRFNESPLVQSSFNGIRPAVTGMIAAAGFDVFKVAVITLNKYLINNNLLQLINLRAACLFVVLVFIRIKISKSPVFLLACGAVAGLILKL